MSRRERILVAEDDEALRAVLVEFFTHHGYRVLEAADGQHALKSALKEKPSLVVLDINLPQLGGLSVLTRLRNASASLPILVLSGGSAVDQRIQGLTLGADDYLGKPFDFGELLARVRALMRRRNPVDAPRRLQLGDTTVDLTNMTAARGDTTVRLSRTESSLLSVLAQNHGRPVTREHLLDAVWGYTYLPNTRTLDTHIWRLRKKLGDTGDEPRWILNVSGVGYKLVADTGAQDDQH